MKFIKSRIYNQLDENQGIEQAGFRKNQSTIDHLQAINQVIEKVLEYNLEIHMLFIDYQKAFDSIDHNYLWVCLKKTGYRNENNKRINKHVQEFKSICKIRQERGNV